MQIFLTMLPVIILNAAHVYALETEFENRSTNNAEGRKADVILNLRRSYKNTETDNPTDHSSKRSNVNNLCSKTMQNICQVMQSLNQTHPRSIAENSLCPWRLTVNENRYREPNKIIEAECLCPGYVEMAGIVCIKVYREMEIKIFMDGYKLRSLQNISVACVPFLLN